MTFLAIVAIAGMAVPLGEWSFLRYARAARAHPRTSGGTRVWSRELAQMRVMLRDVGRGDGGRAGRVGVWPAGAGGAGGRSWAVELLLIGTVAEMVMVLPMAVYFHRATVFALPANMVSVPLVAVLAAGGGGDVCGRAGESVGGDGAGGGDGGAAAWGDVGDRADEPRGCAADVRVPGPAWWVVAVALGAWAWCCWAVRRGGWGAVGTAVALPLVAVLVLWPERAVVTAGRDGGDGDRCGAGGLAAGGGRRRARTMLVDAGGPVGGVDEAARGDERASTWGRRWCRRTCGRGGFGGWMWWC